jgi:acyl carrier protein
MMEQFITDVVELFDEKPNFEINENTIFKDLSGWDSLVSLSLIVMVSNNYEKSIDGETIRNCITIRDLFEVVNA